MSAGEPSGSKPAESVREQFMRTLSAVRTRLRGPVPEDGGELEPPHGYGQETSNGNGRVHDDAVVIDDHAAAGHQGRDAGAGDDSATVADHPVDVAATEQVGPMDPLLAERRSSRSRARARRSMVTAAAVTEAAPDVDDREVTAPLVAPITEPTTETQTETRTSTVKQTRIRSPRVRPALPLLRRRPRVRKVTRIVRKVDAWGVFKISLVFYVILYIILLVAGVLLWNLANTTGTVANVEGFARDLFGLKTFQFDGEKLFRASWVLGAILVVAGTGFNVTMAVLFNLISDLVGGVRVSVLEEEVVLRERPIVPRRPEAVAPDDQTSVQPEMAYATAAEPVVDDEPTSRWDGRGSGSSSSFASTEAVSGPMGSNGEVDATEPAFAPPISDLPPPDVIDADESPAEVIDADAPPPGTV